MEITQIRNATILVEYNGIKFLIDPWLLPKNSMQGFDAAVNSHNRQPRVDLPFSIEKIVDVDCVIVTHIHPDHWDVVAEKEIDKSKKIFVQSEQDKAYIESKGFYNAVVISLDGTIYHSVTLYKTLTQHGKRDVIKPICESMGMPYDAMGVVFEAENEKTLYIAGDTIWCQEVENALEKYSPEVIVLNACAATLLNGERIIMDIKDVQEVLQVATNSRVIISHMDTVSHLTITRKDYEEYKKKNNVKNLLIPNDGQSIRF